MLWMKKTDGVEYLVLWSESADDMAPHFPTTGTGVAQDSTHECHVASLSSFPKAMGDAKLL